MGPVYIADVITELQAISILETGLVITWLPVLRVALLSGAEGDVRCTQPHT
jgi:hypothetical protein